MTDLAADAALVAEALGGAVRDVNGHSAVIVVGEWQETFWGHSSLWRALVALAQDRDRWRAFVLQHAPAAVGGQEREAIVRWLRMLAGKHPGTAYAGALLDAVDDIEAGGHLKPADEGQDA